MNQIGSGNRESVPNMIRRLRNLIALANACDDCGQKELANLQLDKACALIVGLKQREDVSSTDYGFAEATLAFLAANLQAPDVSLEVSRINYMRALALQYFQETEDDRVKARGRVLLSFAEVLRYRGQTSEAAARLAEAEFLLKDSDRHTRALLAYRKAKLFLDQREFTKALKVLESAEQLVDDRQGHRHVNICVAIRIALVTAYRLNGQRDAAQQLVTHINPIVQQLKKIEAAKSPIVIERGSVSKKRRPTTTEKEVVFQPCFPTQLEERALAVAKWSRRLPFFGQLPKQPLEL